MALQREAIYTALLAKLSAAYAWATPPSRRLRDLSEIGNDQQPTAFLLESEREQSAYQKGRALVWTLYPHVLIFARTDDQNAAPASAVLPIVTAVEAALEDTSPSGTTPTTLGGTVSHCRLQSIDLGAGQQGGQAAALLSLEVLAVAS